MAEMIFSVSQINEYLSRKLFRDPFLNSVTIVGEVTNLSMSSIGHAFFSLKDEDSILNCIVYDFLSSEVKDLILDGVLLKVSGRIVFYKKSGMFQLAVDKASLQGVGDLFARFEQTKKRLYEEGLFDRAHKKAMPEFPTRLGIVTSAAGAVMHDIIVVATRRFDGICIMVYPVQVQGQDAPRQICEGIRHFNEAKNVDVIIVARGGGSFEDLFAFNEECVARAVFESDIPVVSAVGHETDYSLCDFAADLRAPTPSAAAELVVGDKSALVGYLKEYKKGILSDLQAIIRQYERQTDVLIGIIKSYSFELKLNQIRDKIISDYGIIKQSISVMLEKRLLMLEKYRGSLESLNPRNILKRGYAIVYDENNNVVASKNNAVANMGIEFIDGRVAVTRVGRKG
ncbi:MAG: exodeoxyribonuclease VII large subunit [Christensenellales bacterium]|jgi:exodeoxyribonuclease VII large subunit